MLLLLFLACAHTHAQRPEIVVQTGHPAGASAVAFSPDGRLVATGGQADSTVKLWDTTTGRELRTLRGFAGSTDTASVVAFGADGKTVLAASQGRMLKVWEVRTGRELHHFTFEHEGSSFGRAFSPDRKVFASGGDDMTLKLWDVATGRLLRVLRARGMKVQAVAFSPDGETVAGGGTDKTLKLWNAKTGALLLTLAVPSGIVNAIAFSPDGKFIAGGAYAEKTVKLWDAKTGRLVRTLAAHTESVNSVHSVAFSPDGRTLVSQGGDSAVKLWDVASGKLLRAFVGGSTIGFSPDGRLFAMSVSGGVKLLDAVTWQETIVLRARTAFPDVVAFSPNGKMVAYSAGKNYKLWNTSTGRELSTLNVERNTLSPHLAFSPDSRLLAASSAFNAMSLWETDTGKERLKWGKEYYLDSFIPAFSPGGRHVVTASSNGRIVYWEPGTGKPVGALNCQHPISRMALSPDGALVVESNFGEFATVWEISTSRKRFELRGHAKPVSSIAFSPDGKTLASASWDKTIKLWEMGTGAELRTLAGHTDDVMTVAYGPGGQVLASGGRDGTVRLWDTGTGRELRALPGTQGLIVTSVAFSPDGKIVAGAGFDAGVKLWDAATGEELASLIAVDEGDWLVVTPDGLFDGSPAAWGLILWRFGGDINELLPVEAFFDEFFYPGLLADLLAGQRPKAARDIAEKDRRQPVLKISMAAPADAASKVGARQVTLKVEVTKAEAGAKDVRLFRNGSLVKVWRGDVLKGQPSAVLEANVTAVAGENRLTAYAFNRDNVKSADAVLSFGGAEGLRRGGTAYVLAVGINGYANPDFNLRYAVADARTFGEEWKRQQAMLRRYERVEIIPLHDADATKANILRALAELSEKAQPEDALVFYFAGHGTAHENRFYLLPHDLGYAGARDRIDRAGLEQVLAHSISDRELEQSFERIDSSQLLLVIDACNSGQALEAEEKRRGPMNSKGLAQLAYEKGMYVLTAAQSFQAAQEVSQLGHGLLTYALVEEGLKTAAADGEPKDGSVFVREWLDYVTRRVPEMQVEEMQRAATRGVNLSFADQERGLSLPQRSGQRPRVFYRRELEALPLLVARPGTR